MARIERNGSFPAWQTKPAERTKHQAQQKRRNTRLKRVRTGTTIGAGKLVVQRLQHTATAAAVHGGQKKRHCLATWLQRQRTK
jgi:hypothetical protein